MAANRDIKTTMIRNDRPGVRAGGRSPVLADLETLSHHGAVITIAARAARRVQPLLSMWPELPAKHEAAVHAALTVTESIAARQRVPQCGRLRPRIMQILEAAVDLTLGASLTESEGCEEADSPEIVYTVCLTASFAIEAAFDADMAAMLATAAIERALLAFEMAFPSARESEAFRRAIASDIDFLTLYLAQLDDPDERPVRSIDVGILWPEGEPERVARMRLGGLRHG